MILELLKMLFNFVMYNICLFQGPMGLRGDSGRPGDIGKPGPMVRPAFS